MKYRHIKNLRAVGVASSDDISALPSALPKPSFKTKSEYREWCGAADTDHCFYSLGEGDNPTIRISTDNPINRLHGFVADYDAPVDWSAIDTVIRVKCPEGLKPTWRTRTQSGYARLVWEFEKPLPIAPELAEQFLKRLGDQVKASMLLAGFDRTSFKPTQMFELGEDWVRVGDPLEQTVVRTVLLKAANDAPIRTEDTSIPIEEIAAEVERRFGGRWNGDFTVGARGPLFWINDGVDRQGCQVREDGMICYSDRAGKGFVGWREIF